MPEICSAIESLRSVAGPKLELCYELRWLGGGLFGGVFEATLQDGCKVAVKVPSHSSGPHSPEQNLRQLVEDARAASALSHPNLIQLLGWTQMPVPALVWELLPGSLPMALAAIASRSSALDPTQLMSQVQSASAYCSKQLHALWDSPPVEARLDANDNLVLTDCFMRPSEHDGNLASLPPPLRCGGAARGLLLKQLGRKTVSMSVNLHVTAHHLLCLELAVQGSTSEALAAGRACPEEGVMQLHDGEIRGLVSRLFRWGSNLAKGLLFGKLKMKEFLTGPKPSISWLEWGMQECTRWAEDFFDYLPHQVATQLLSPWGGRLL
ncbi:LECRK53 [Symbiodinium necroappetens]|uniref:LECRK53 protein n=1 Tax=Symbiodinium necroappetens TaxID=1628268 RepID=A0A813BWY1_9DINO|nr:LECRK53 [Symbiodinium necroappetens]